MFTFLLILFLSTLQAGEWYDDLLGENLAPLSIETYRIGGGILYTRHQGKTWYLLGQEGLTAKPDVQETWCPFVGMYEPQKHSTIYDTVIAEVEEESAGVYIAPLEILYSSQVHKLDYVSPLRKRKMLAFIPTPMVKSAEEIMEAREKCVDADFKEKANYAWVAIPSNFNFPNVESHKAKNEGVVWDVLNVSQSYTVEKRNFLLRSSFVEDLMQPQTQEILKKLNTPSL